MKLLNNKVHIRQRCSTFFFDRGKIFEGGGLHLSQSCLGGQKNARGHKVGHSWYKLLAKSLFVVKILFFIFFGVPHLAAFIFNFYVM